MEQSKLPVRSGGKPVRDISTSLGKLPPQSPEMEAAVLGAILLFKDALPKVSGYLKPHHFYLEQNVVIYRAILNLHTEGTPIDLLNIRDRLKSTGQMEIVGGAYYIAELSNNVTSAANIESHARTVIEKAMAREVIKKASAMHDQAYDDTNDPFEMIDGLMADLQSLRDTSTKQTPESIVKKQWETRFLTTAPPKTVPLITIDGHPVVCAGNYSLLIGKKKSRKTLFMVWLISEYIKRHPDHYNRIILFDTEQGIEEVWKIREKIHRLSGKWVPIAFMRGQSPAERRDFIKYTVQFWPERPVLCSIDGVRDLVSNINDPDECTDAMVWLDRLTMDHDLAIINVIHMNKADSNARGHLGSELANKSLCTIEMELDQKTNLTIVKCESSRYQSFDSFAFTHSGDGLPTLADMPIGGKGAVMPKSDLAKRLEAAFVDGPMKYKDTWVAIGIQFEAAEAKSKRLVARFIRDGMIMKSGKDRDPNTLYKLISSEAPDQPERKLTPMSKILSPDAPQPDLFSNGKIHHKKQPEILDDGSDLPF